MENRPNSADSSAELSLTEVLAERRALGYAALEPETATAEDSAEDQPTTEKSPLIHPDVHQSHMGE